MDSKRYPMLTAVSAQAGLMDEQFQDENLQRLQQQLQTNNPQEWAEGLKWIVEREVHNSKLREFATGFIEELANI